MNAKHPTIKVTLAMRYTFNPFVRFHVFTFHVFTFHVSRFHVFTFHGFTFHVSYVFCTRVSQRSPALMPRFRSSADSILFAYNANLARVSHCGHSVVQMRSLSATVPSCWICSTVDEQRPLMRSLETPSTGFSRMAALADIIVSRPSLYCRSLLMC